MARNWCLSGRAQRRVDRAAEATELPGRRVALHHARGMWGPSSLTGPCSPMVPAGHGGHPDFAGSGAAGSSTRGAREQRRVGTDSERFRQMAAAFAASATASRILSAMYSSHGFRTAPISSGWVQTGELWALWYHGRGTANVTFDGGPGVRLWMEGQKMWHTKEARG